MHINEKCKILYVRELFEKIKNPHKRQTRALKNVNYSEGQILSLTSHSEEAIQCSMLLGKTLYARVVVPLTRGLERQQNAVYSCCHRVFSFSEVGANYRASRSAPVPRDITGKGSLI